jgi:hypothetical protein
MNGQILRNPTFWTVLLGLVAIPEEIWLWSLRIFVGQNGTRVWTPEIIIILGFFIYTVYKFIFAWLSLPVTHHRGRRLFVSATEDVLISAETAKPQRTLSSSLEALSWIPQQKPNSGWFCRATKLGSSTQRIIKVTMCSAHS